MTVTLCLQETSEIFILADIDGLLMDFVKMIHSTSKTYLVEPSWGVSTRAATASEKPCSLIAEGLGARHGDLGFADSCVKSDWMVESADWAGTGGWHGYQIPEPGHVGPLWGIGDSADRLDRRQLIYTGNNFSIFYMFHNRSYASLWWLPGDKRYMIHSKTIYIWSLTIYKTIIIRVSVFPALLTKPLWVKQLLSFVRTLTLGWSLKVVWGLAQILF